MIISQTPLRISIAGGGTDFDAFCEIEEGCVVSSAIDKFVFVIVKERFDDEIYINYSRKEIVSDLDELEHELVREAMRKVGVLRGVEITTLADIPSEGSGLGSSSSVTVGLLNALYAYVGDPRPLSELAQHACEIEIKTLGKPIGRQDQYIAAYGGMRCLRFRRDGTVEQERLRCAESTRRRLGENLMLFYTNRTRKSAEILAEQEGNILQRLSPLRAIKAHACHARRLLLEGKLDELGVLLDSTWKEKRRLTNRISDDEIDTMYERARDAGALGGKISGAGGGGFLLLYCPAAKQQSVRNTLKGYREMPFALEPDGSKIIFNVRREGWRGSLD